MATPPVGTILYDEFHNLITLQNDAQTGKAPCILVGVTESGTRTYQSFGDIVMYEGKKIPAVEDIVWCIGSNTKVFAGTTLAVAITVQGAPVPIALDTAVADFLPQGVTIDLFGTDAIQVQHLATHTAGWPDGMCYEKGSTPVLGDYTFGQMQDFLGNFKPLYAPGTLFYYSNQSFALLGTLVSQAWQGTPGSQPANWRTYQHWPKVVTETVIGPLGLTSTQVDYTPIVDRMLASWRLVDEGHPYNPAPPPNWVLDSASLAAGSLSSTLADMLTFLEAQITPSSTPIEDAILLTQAQPIASIPMGLGWQIGEDYFSKDGLVRGYTSFMIVDPASAIGVVAVANADHCTGAIAEACGLTLARLRQSAVHKITFPQPAEAPACP